MLASKCCRSANKDVSFWFVSTGVVWNDIAGTSCKVKRYKIAAKSTGVGVRVKFTFRSVLG